MTPSAHTAARPPADQAPAAGHAGIGATERPGMAGTPERRTGWHMHARYAAALFLLALGTFQVLRARAINLQEFADFQTFYTAARAYSQDINPYGHLGPWPYLYPPPLLTFIAPLTRSGLEGAVLVWTSALFGVFLAVSYLAARLAWLDTAPPWPMLVVPPLLAYRFVLRSSNFGQVDLVVFLAVLLGLLALRARWPVAAGTGLAVAAMIKVLPGLFAGYLLLRDRRALAAMLVALALLALAPVADRGWPGAMLWSEWVHGDVVGHATDVTHDNDRANQSVSATAARWLAMAGRPEESLARAAWGTAALLVLGVTAAALALGRSTVAIEGSLVLLAIHLVSRKTWETHLVTLILPYAALLATAITGATRECEDGDRPTVSPEARRTRRTIAMAGITAAAVLTHIHSPLFVGKAMADTIQSLGPTTLAIAALWVSLLLIHHRSAR